MIRESNEIRHEELFQNLKNVSEQIKVDFGKRSMSVNYPKKSLDHKLMVLSSQQANDMRRQKDQLKLVIAQKCYIGLNMDADDQHFKKRSLAYLEQAKFKLQRANDINH